MIKEDKRTFRDLELFVEGTMEQLHLAIIKAFNFDNDHLYVFFLDNKWWSREVAVWDPRTEDKDGGKDASRVHLFQLELKKKDKFLYLFDFGDEWMFEVEFLGSGEGVAGRKYPRVVKKSGEAPEQYGNVS